MKVFNLLFMLVFIACILSVAFAPVYFMAFTVINGIQKEGMTFLLFGIPASIAAITWCCGMLSLGYDACRK